MNFDFSDDQKMLKDQARKFLEDKCSYDDVRTVLESDASHNDDVWQGLCDLGFTGAAIPEEYGGLGLSALELCVVAEELGRSAAPVPFSSSIYMAAEALKLGGSEELKQAWLPKLASGEVIGTFAAAEGPAAPSPRNTKTSFAKGKLNGRKLPVPDGETASVAIVLANTGGTGEQAVSLVVVDLTQSSVTRASIETIDPTRGHAEISFDDADATLLGEAGEGWSLMKRIEAGAAVLVAFEQVGGTEAALNMAKDYSLDRYAFGRQIGSYQAIKHKLADMYVKLELARSNAYYGAMVLAQEGADLELAAASARISATEAYRFAAQECIQVHGGIGFTWEANPQFHYRRSKLLALSLGSASRWKNRLVAELEKSNVA
ncbi:MAG: acyl-CoA/acyl-ACP dehydrogenase [Alphaproteobacteria bacterium]|nr:acyl-CoA/acyl-ACP dehydrogenase [Alphaproteobacteria bacterium]